MTTQTKDEQTEEPDTIDGEAVELDEEDVLVEATPEQAEAMVQAESQALAVREEREQAPHPVAVLPSPGEWEATMTMARTIANTPFVPEGYRGQPEAVVAAILYGREIGVGPMQALRQIHMIDGKPSLSAELMMAQMRRGGLVVLHSESTRERAWIHARRSDTHEEAEVEWTMDEARQIQTRERGQNITLAEKNTWRSYPADMLWARCVGRLARRLGSDLLGGMVYATEEMQDWDDGGYGGSGYDTPAAEKPKRAVTSDGVEMRADAPQGWTQIMETLKGIDPAMPWKEWVAQASHVLTGKTAFADLSEQEKIDCGIRVANGVAHLTVALAGRDFPPPSREEVQTAFAQADSVAAVLAGPDTPLDPTEATGAAESAGNAEAGENPDGAADAQETPAGDAGEQETPDGEEGGDDGDAD